MTAELDWRRRLFGEQLLRPAPDAGPSQCPVDVLAPADSHPEVLALYFRALSDCDDCPLTEALRELYTSVSPRLQVVQVYLPSWLGFPQTDRGEPARQFTLSYPGVPWYTMPIDDQVKWVRLKHRFRGKVGKLVLLSAHSGKVLVNDASHKLQEDPQGLHFPWLPRSLSVILSEAAQKGIIAGGLKKGPKIIPYNSIDGCIKGLYFSAHWCPPCKAFTPQLVNCYRKIKSQGHKFEIIFVSSDRSEESYENYLAVMPWAALPFKNGVGHELASALDIHGIPSLVLVEPDGSIITTDARSELRDDPDAELFPWRRRLVSVLTERMAGLLYDSPAIVLFVDGEEDEDLEFGQAVLLPVAEWATAKATYLDYEFLFFIAVENDAGESLRQFTKLEDISPLVTVIDFPLNRFSVMEHSAEITEHSVKAFVSDFFAEKLTFKPISDKS